MFIVKTLLQSAYTNEPYDCVRNKGLPVDKTGQKHGLLLKLSAFVLVNSANTVPGAINRAICRSLRLNLWKIANFVFLRRGEVRAEGDLMILN